MQIHQPSKAYIEKTNSSITIDNGCYLYVEEFVGTLNMGDTSSAEIEDFGDHSNNYNTQITMGDNSMITVLDEAELSQAQFMGPNNEYALVKINKIEDIGNFSSQGNIHYEVKEIDDDITEDIWWEAKFLDAIKNTEGTISKWGESPITIPAGDCTGEGNTPDESGSETPTDPVSYTYVFEDNFPLVGDYDFNDVVLDVETYYHREKKTNHIKRIQLDVTLAAAGATKALGVGLRIVGINKSAIKEIKTGGDDSRFQESFNSSYNKFRYNNVTYMEDSDPSVVIPIAGEVHNVFGVEPGEMVNTGIGVTAKKYTYEVIIELADQTRTEPHSQKTIWTSSSVINIKAWNNAWKSIFTNFGDMAPLPPEPYSKRILTWQATTRGQSACRMASAIPKKQSMCHVLISPRQAHIRNSSIGPKTEPSIRNGTNTR